MTAIAQALGEYRSYHRDSRNVATHAIGIPLIVLAVEILLSRPQFPVGTIVLNPAIFASALASLYYLWLDLRFGLVMALLLAICAWLGVVTAQNSLFLWLGSGIALFVVGWAFQFVGHFFEGRKPAFVDDIKSLLIGPLFILVELAFAFGLRPGLKTEMELY